MIYMPMPYMKRCKKCGNMFVYGEMSKWSGAQDGVKSLCKACDARIHREKRAYKPKIDPGVPAGFKRCYQCKSVKPATTEFFFERKLVAGKTLCSYCKACTYQNSAQFRKDRPGHRREYLRQYDQEHRVERSEKDARRRREDPNRRARQRRNQRTYQERHPDKRSKNTAEQNKTYHQRRHARLSGLPDALRVEHWQRALDYFGGCCAICGRSADSLYAIAMDHWIPLSSPNCPGTVPTNVAPLCHARKGGTSGCNNTKHSRDALEWLTDRYGPFKAQEIYDRIQKYFEWVKSQD